MDTPPPSPHDGFLRTNIPCLATCETGDLVSMFAASREEQELIAHADESAPGWLWAMAELHRDRGRFASALGLATRSIEAAIRVGSSTDQVQGLAVRASIQVIQGNFDSARETLAQIPVLMRGDGNLRMSAIYEETFAVLLLRTVGSTVFEFEEAGDRFQKAGGLYRVLGDVPGQIRCIAGSASVSSGRGEYFAALEHVDKGLELAADSGQWKHLGQLLGCAAFAFRDQGYRHNVHELFELATEWATFVGDIPQRVRIIGGHGELYRMEFAPPSLDGYDKAGALIQQAIDESKEIGAGPLMLEMQMAMATLYRKAGDRESHAKSMVLAEQIAASETFEGANRLIDWNNFIEDRLIVARDERIASRLEEAIEGSADPFFVFDPRQGSDAAHFALLNEFRNSAANQMLNVDSVEVRLLGDLGSVPEFGGLRDPLMAAAAERKSYEDEVRIEKPDGTVIWYGRRVVPAGAGAVVTFRDVSTSHRIEDALRVAAESAREADRAKSEFLANMSHEVRTPINGVLGLARLLRELDLDPLARKYVDGIVSSGNILLKVIGDVLDLSKIEARRMQVNSSPINLHSLVGEVISLFAGQAATSKVDLHYKIESDIPLLVIVDGTYLRQVLANLVGNAVKFTSAGQIEVTVCRKPETLLFEVTDTGVGVPEDQIEAIFEPFQQATADTDWGGTGLGLTISRRLIELMGGEMGVTSKKGEGSRFFFTLPLLEAPGPAPEDGAPAIGDSARFEGKRVLLVDDNAVNTLVSEGMVSRLGCTVTTAENGQEAVDLFATKPFDLILMDMRMPVMDGLTATRLIRKSEATAGGHIPIIALTAGALTQERDACLEAGMDDYLVKPFTLRGLREALFRAFGEGY